MSLYNAADDDVGTGGPDLVRGIYPTAKFVTAQGITDVSDDQIRAAYDGLIAIRRSRET
jgi:proteasome beta subunit